MSSTPEPRGLVLRDDLPAPAWFPWPVPPGATLLTALPVSPGEPAHPGSVGVALLSGELPVLSLDQLWVRHELLGRGLGRRLEELVRARVVAAGATVLTARVPQGHGPLEALAAGTRVLGEYLTAEARSDRVLPARFGWRAMTSAEYEVFYEAQVQAYARANLIRSGGDPTRALERSRADFAEVLPDGPGTADTSLVVLTVDGERVGHLWLAHHRFRGETFGYDLEIVPGRRLEGWARAAIALAGRLAHEAGDVRLGLHVFGDNAAARPLYVSEGFVVRVTTHDLLARS